MDAMRGPGRFQWNAGGWFGAQIGASCWLAPMAVLLFLKNDQAGALAIAVAFCVVNVVGTALWALRRKTLPYPALQTLLAGCALASLAALYILISSPALHREILAGWRPWNALFSLSVFPGLMVMFHFLEKEARKRSGEDLPSPPDVRKDRTKTDGDSAKPV